MARKPEQGKRRAAFESGLGTDVLAITGFEAEEELNQLFEMRIDAVSDQKNIDFNKVLGTKCAVRINTTDEQKRYFNGTLVEAFSLGQVRDVYSYRIILRPWLWLLTKTSNCRIFKQKNVREIIAEVLNNHSFASFEDRTSGSFPALEYCVQYCENDFSFVCRLMEEYGIYYFFDHSKGDHKLIMADSISAHKPKFGGAETSFVPYSEKHFQNKETLNEWVNARQFCSGMFAYGDYNYMKPDMSLLVEKSASSSYQNGALEVYHYPGRYEEKSDGNTKVGAWMEAEQALDQRSRASGDVVSCSPGGKLKLRGNPQVADGTEFLILGAKHVYRAPQYMSEPHDMEDSYNGQFEFLPVKIPFRPLARTIKPRIAGPQTAFVVGDGEIDVDEHGRIEVKFHWAKDRDLVQSRRVRISHGWSGASWGDIKIPRVGMEVVVEFLNGDPDQPLVTGTVYNGNNATPYDLPADKTISGVKSKTDGGDGYNELIFDDRDGNELIRFHAERDLEGKVENDERRDVGHNVNVKIGNNRAENIGLEWSAEAGTRIEFKCGQSSIVMTPASIEIKSVSITISASANLVAKGSAMTNVESSGPTIVKGAIITLN